MDSNLLNLAPSIALDTLSIIILLLSWWMLEYPAGYVPVNNQDHNQMEESRLKKLNIGTKISCFLLISLASTEFYLRSKDSNDIQWNLILQISYFLVLAICSHRLNYTLNAYAGGQIAVFMTLVLVIAELVLNLYQRFPFLAELPDILVLGKAIILFSTLLTYGLWDHVAELPTRPNLSKEAGASILSRLFFCWVSPLIILGNSKSLVLEDIWGLVDSDLSLNVTEHHKTTNDQERSLLWNLTQLSLPFAVYQGVCSLLSTFLTFANPYFLFRIIKAVQAQNVPKVVIILDLVLMFVMAAMQTLLLGQVYFIGRRFGLRARVAIIDQIYQKSLKRAHIASNSDEESASSGKIVNLMSVDAERINVFLSYYHDIYIRIPISILLAVGSLFLIMGWSAMVGVFLSFLLAWLSFALGKWVMNLQTNLLKSTDKRVGAMNELLNGIKIIKFFAWESYFQSKVDLIRKEELENLVKLWGGRLLFSTIGTGSGVLIALGTFAAYTLLSGSVLDAATAFTAISLLRVVSQHLTNLPYLVMIAFNAFVSAERVEEFLAEQNIDSLSNSGGSMVVEENSTIIGFRDASFVYHSCASQHSKFKLRTLNLSFPVNGLTLICGSTGSGKSSLLLAFLGELKCIEGRILKPEISHQIDKKTGLSKTISYVAQTAWLLNATIRDNILFGQEYDRLRYEAVIQGCALKKDFDIFEGGDLTEVGEKGVTLSGGQKQRISLARACYSNAAIVLLDDPLSAVDPPTASFLLHHCILKLLKNRTVLLVSHATSLVAPHAQLVVKMKNGRVCHQEDCNDITPDFNKERQKRPSAIPSTHKHGSELDSMAKTVGVQLVQDECQAVGSVNLKLYKFYFLSSGAVPLLIGYILSYIISTAAKLLNDFWLKHWTESSTLSEIILFQSNRMGIFSIPSRIFSTVMGISLEENLYFVKVYALLGLGIIVAENLQTVVFLLGSLFASVKLHDKLLKSILRSPLRFFEVTPIGRILNRFSKDIDTIDSFVMPSIRRFVQRILQVLTIIGLISFATPSFLVFTPFIGFFFAHVARRYLSVSRELKRYESTTKSPIFAQFSETLSGAITIRAYGASSRFSRDCNKKVDINHQPYFFVWAANRWLSIRTDLMSALVVFISGCVVVLTNIAPGLAALAITYSLEFSDSLLWAVRTHAELEMSMNSVERIHEYLELEQEEDLKDNISENWPEHGDISVKDLRIRYAPDLPNVLHGVTFRVKDGEKVAIVGRTGAGKSSISSALFRMVPIVGGAIFIDDVDISQVALSKLRSKITIIPQDPVLFSGTLRSNLDPTESFEDAVIWDTLKRVHFLDTAMIPANSSESLNTDVAYSVSLDMNLSSNGDNFSLGQKQLLCLARSLLQGNKIIVLDEATASVDGATDSKIQETIRTEFTAKTVICVAHRLRTIIDYDKILVLDKGCVKEFGSPAELMRDSNSLFTTMCKESGEYDVLLSMAKKVTS